MVIIHLKKKYVPSHRFQRQSSHANVVIDALDRSATWQRSRKSFCELPALLWVQIQGI